MVHRDSEHLYSSGSRDAPSQCTMQHHGAYEVSTVRQSQARGPSRSDARDIVRRYRAGETVREIAATVSWSRATVFNVLRREGVQLRRRGPRPGHSGMRRAWEARRAA
jgi:hypothetical protein